MNMWQKRLSLGLAVVFTISAGVQGRAQAVSSSGKSDAARRTAEAAEWKKLSRPPADTSDAQNLRIWFAPRHDGNCRFRITVVDSSRLLKRHIIERMLIRGYYNLYWDKRDDSGRLVQPGKYRYIVTSACGPQSEGRLTVSYKKWERALRLAPDTTSDTAAVVLRVDSANIKITLRVLTPDSVLVGTLCSDSVFAIGRHRLVWAPREQLAFGDYVVRMTAGDYVTEERVRLK